MAITANMAVGSTQGRVVLENLHCVLVGYNESFKGNLTLRVSMWHSKQYYLQGLSEMSMCNFTVLASQLPQADTMRASIYLYLMQQPEFINPVADMDDDFPVTPIE